MSAERTQPAIGVPRYLLAVIVVRGSELKVLLARLSPPRRRIVGDRREHQRCAARPPSDQARSESFGPDAVSPALLVQEAMKRTDVLAQPPEDQVAAILRPVGRDQFSVRRQRVRPFGLNGSVPVLAGVTEDELTRPDQVLAG